MAIVRETGADRAVSRDLDAAQASRDRKKEHTQLLEIRVAELEAQLHSSGSGSSSNASASTSTKRRRTQTQIRAPLSPPPSSSSSSSRGESPQVAHLEDENQSLRQQLCSAQEESTNLRNRLESLEAKFGMMEHYMTSQVRRSGDVKLPSPQDQDPPITFSLLPAFEPTFSFAQSTSPSQQLQVSPLLNDVTLLPLQTLIKQEQTSEPTKVTEELKSEEGDQNLTQDNSRLVAREVVLSLQRKLSQLNFLFFLSLFFLLQQLSKALLFILRRPLLSPTSTSTKWKPVIVPCRKSSLINLNRKMRKWRLFGTNGLMDSLSLSLRSNRRAAWNGSILAR